MSETSTKDAMLAAAEAGDDKAQTELAMMYEHGIGCPKDYQTAAKWYTAAADKGNGFAAYKLALMYENGLMGGPSPKDAMSWLRRAAETGLSEAQHKLGIMLDREENPKEAADWLQKAADQKVSDAQWRLGVLYEHGRGVAKDTERAAKLYTAASAQNHPNAHYSLGVMYITGEGVPVNPGEAMRLLTMAAEMGNLQAKKRLDAAKTGKEPEPDHDSMHNKKKEEAKPHVEESVGEMFTKSIVPSLIMSGVLVVLVLTPLGEILTEVTKAIGPFMGAVAIVGALIGVLAMGTLFKMRKAKQEDAWFKITCMILAALGMAAVLFVIGFSKFQIYNPDTDGKKGQEHQNSDKVNRLLERAKQQSEGK